MKKIYYQLIQGGFKAWLPAVELSTHHAEVKGSSPVNTTLTGRKKLAKDVTWGQCFKTFYGRDLLIFI